ncbi:low molecular weight protein-tyrosine-phosphatase [Cyanobium sp. NIES-981]|uniref:low molecular weight protein-tyrosine-phosphatase n=1 Tax=Cyanobium sp. NIES-981 TaxID=1851505 RepID=UPI0007DE1DEE|nr:low molecular weight protein-tyrosine-phosphatase [Cyanobium sp. NIES-981]SBO43509.1 putative Protein-tyrosine-phosphatase [Cyanobium sp. NIES-981]
MTEPTRVLFVCLGNICRSPAAEGVFLHLLAQRQLEDQFVVDSAGTGGWHTGRPADRRMQAAAAQRGLTLTSRARQLQLADLTSFDHILTMDDDNLAQVRGLSGELGSRADLARIEPLTRYCREHQAEAVPDPYYGGPEGFDRVLDLLFDACLGLVEHLRPSP